LRNTSTSLQYLSKQAKINIFFYKKTVYKKLEDGASKKLRNFQNLFFLAQKIIVNSTTLYIKMRI